MTFDYTKPFRQRNGMAAVFLAYKEKRIQPLLVAIKISDDFSDWEIGEFNKDGTYIRKGLEVDEDLINIEQPVAPDNPVLAAHCSIVKRVLELQKRIQVLEDSSDKNKYELTEEENLLAYPKQEDNKEIEYIRKIVKEEISNLLSENKKPEGNKIIGNNNCQLILSFHIDGFSKEGSFQFNDAVKTEIKAQKINPLQLWGAILSCNDIKALICSLQEHLENKDNE